MLALVCPLCYSCSCSWVVEKDTFKCFATASKIRIQQAKFVCFMGVLCQLSGLLNVPIGLFPFLDSFVGV